MISVKFTVTVIRAFLKGYVTDLPSWEVLWISKLQSLPRYNVQSFKPLLLFNKLHCVTNCSVFKTQWVIDCPRTIIKGNLSRSCNIMSICYLVQSKQCFSERSAKSNRNIRHEFHSTSNCRVTLTTGNQTNSCKGKQILLQDLHTNVVWMLADGENTA